MRYLFLFLSLSLLGFTIKDPGQVDETLITYPYLEISRLGDYARGYLNAKWIAAALGVPVVLRPFPHSSKLRISENLQYRLDESLKKENFTELTREQMEKICKGELTKEVLGPGIFTIPFPWVYRISIPRSENREFISQFIDDFLPASHIRPSLILPREGRVNIALHVRDGGSFDLQEDKFICPDRFPPLSYYDCQLEKVLALHEGKAVHIQVFTDSLDPERLRDRFLGIALRFCRDATIGSRENGEDCNETIVSDLLSLSHFPIVIRSNCYFSGLASFLGQPLLEFYPFKAKLHENGVAETHSVCVITRSPEGEREEVIEERHVKEWPSEELSGFDRAWAKYREMFGG